MTKRVLVTGGSGYIGSHTVVELQNLGYEVLILDNLSNSKIDVVDNIAKITGQRPGFECVDLCDYDRVSSILAEEKPFDAVIHFAALKAVGDSVNNPIGYYNNNLVSMINVLKLCKEYAIPHLCFSSSCTVYGQPDKLPVTEGTPRQQATSPYGQSKIMCEDIIKDTCHSDPDFNCIALRYFNPVGAHESALIGELPNGVPSNLVPFLTQSVAGIRGALSVFGNDYDTPDGSCIRDYIHVVDLAKAHVASLDRMFDGKCNDAFEYFNVGTGRGVSVLEIISEFENATGETVNYQISNRREGDIEQIYADTSLANEQLNWKAESTLQDTLRSAWNWQKELVK